MIVYMSGTGNSRRCARVLARELEDELLDAFYFIRDGIAAECLSGKPWVFVAPTYAWQIPRIFGDFIRNGFWEGSREAYFVLTCGSDIGAAAPALQALCREKGLEFRGVWQQNMPENYIALFNAPSEAETERIVSAADRQLLEAAACIREGRSFPEKKLSFADKVKSGPVNRGFYRFYIRSGPFRAGENCSGCGLCTERCILGNLRLEAGKPVWGDRCTHCMACITSCPAGAIEYGRFSRGKRRYRCPEE